MTDYETLQNDLHFFKDEVIRLERELNDYEVQLYDKEKEIARLLDEQDVLLIELSTLRDTLYEATGKHY